MPDGFWMGIATLVMGMLGFLPALLGGRRKRAETTGHRRLTD